ncbi:DNA internalization-related competence protein ComEC/Rec2 [Oceanobacillus damuensis]|uniref:DNA internalization-related competence protein ComEC/Rec2 n=1 Tax=Oceanobacillus damuensis TaxID=937928 RepID=UPI00082EDBED|nr:DNA internalization-related competence protein ComEC/Rec2 [Oceanobacillus damuensis]
MKGYWHLVALAGGAAIIKAYFHNQWIILAFLLWLFYLYYYERLGKWPIIVSLTVFIFFSLYIPSIDKQVYHDNHFPTEQSLYTGKIVSPVLTTKDKLEFTLEERKSGNSILILYFPNNDNETYRNDPHFSSLQHGATCMLEGIAELPAESRNPGQFDYRHFLLTKGISHQLVLDSLENISCNGSSFLNRFYLLRQYLLRHIETQLSAFTSSWLTAIVFGEDSSIDSETEKVFQRWSLTHIIAISGSNIGLIVGIFYFMLIRLQLLTKEKTQWLVIFLLPVYALLAGGEPSVWRASVMVVAFILFNKYRFKFSYTDVLSIVFLLLILFDKYIVYHVGFQLSFIVTFAIFLSSKWVAESKSPFWQVLQISFVSQMVIIPIQLAYFSIFQPLSIILNLLIIPYFTLFAIPLMYILLPLSFFPSVLVRPLDSIFAEIHSLVISFTAFVDRNFYFPFLSGGLPLIAAIIYFGLFFVFMGDLQRRRLKQAFRTGVLLCLLVMLIAAKPYYSSTGTVTMFDIGQGDAFLIELPYRKGVVMIDAGARFSFENMEASENVYEQILKPYFYSRGIRKLDALIISHEDLDHMGSATFILQNMEVEEIIVSDYFDEILLSDLINGNSNTNIRKVHRDDSEAIGGNVFHVLAPGEERFSANENSLVLLSELGGANWLFTGDIGKDEEKELLGAYPNLSLDVLKVAHHGSNTSTDPIFLERTSPRFALISVGENNRYGHPAVDVLDALKEKGVVILRTDQSGAVQYIFNGQGGTFFTYIP